MATVASPRRGRNFEAFVQQHAGLLRNYMAGQVAGSNVNAEDALQEGLVRIWREWEGWPGDHEEQLRYAQRALRCAAVDAIRREHGRDGARPQTLSVDFQLAEAGGGIDNGHISDPALAALGLALAEQAAEQRDDERFVERGVLVGALVALKPLERRVVWELAREQRSYKEVATELGITPMKVRDVFFEARALLRTLIAHADGSNISRAERAQLFDLLDGELKGREKRIAQRHLDSCEACQRLAAIERNVTTAGAHVFLPLPMVLMGVWHAGKGAGASFAPVAPASFVTGAGKGLVGMIAMSTGAKVAVGLTTVTLVGSGTVAAVLSKPDQPQKVQDAAASTLPPASSGPTEPDRAAHPLGAVAPAPAKPHRRAHKTARHPRHVARHRKKQRHAQPSAGTQTAASTLPAAASTRAPAASHPSQPSRPSGGEFTLGSGP
jgi:RNA polymerase sigma factor (sigma-70 family)